MYFFNFVDRSNLDNARLGGLEKDLKMTGTDFNLATSILFIGYIIMQLPSNLRTSIIFLYCRKHPQCDLETVITMIRPSLYLGCVMTVWWVAHAHLRCHGGSQNAGDSSRPSHLKRTPSSISLSSDSSWALLRHPSSPPRCSSCLRGIPALSLDSAMRFCEQLPLLYQPDS